MVSSDWGLTLYGIYVTVHSSGRDKGRHGSISTVTANVPGRNRTLLEEPPPPSVNFPSRWILVILQVMHTHNHTHSHMHSHTHTHALTHTHIHAHTHIPPQTQNPSGMPLEDTSLPVEDTASVRSTVTWTYHHQWDTMMVVVRWRRSAQRPYM